MRGSRIKEPGERWEAVTNLRRFVDFCHRELQQQRSPMTIHRLNAKVVWWPPTPKVITWAFGRRAKVKLVEIEVISGPYGLSTEAGRPVITMEICRDGNLKEFFHSDNYYQSGSAYLISAVPFFLSRCFCKILG